MFRVFRSKEAGQNEVGTGYKPSNVNNINNVRCEATVHFRNKKQVYLKAKVEELETVR